ncbi:MAG: hypothetical protein AB7N70_37040 [Dehalococcoidia bacterium]
MSVRTFTQEWSGVWPGGHSVAAGFIRFPVSHLSEEFGIAFKPGADDLGSFVEAALRLRSGRAILLVQRTHPTAPIEIYVDANDRPSEAVRELETALGLVGRQVVQRISPGSD